MAIEVMAEEYAKFLGYFTETRVPFKFNKGNSDIDVLGYNPITKKTLVIECKAWGSPEQYPSYTKKKEEFLDTFRKIIAKWDYFKASQTNRWNLSNLDTIWYVLPGYCENKLQLEQELSNLFNCEISIIPIHELLLKIMIEVKRDKDIRRKRYSNSALEFCRWLLRSYDAGQLNLIDVDLLLKGEKQTYDILKRNYFKECIRAVKRNAEKKGAFINTRLNTLAILSEIKRGTISDLEKKGHNLGNNLNYSRISVGLGTWIELGIVCGSKKDGFYIADAFEKIVKDELEQLNCIKIADQDRGKSTSLHEVE